MSICCSVPQLCGVFHSAHCVVDGALVLFWMSASLRLSCESLHNLLKCFALFRAGAVALPAQPVVVAAHSTVVARLFPLPVVDELWFTVSTAFMGLGSSVVVGIGAGVVRWL